ncbi:tetratricopeptide repeat protein [Geobacter sp.]|uniref:tetratricopeptide repeat protein n=1 Tax=Geobacter sp. TaxID=46610 RepID=UPI0026300039|nr:tetratricopeptide repeat protein [Geobacter sp.]
MKTARLLLIAAMLGTMTACTTLQKTIELQRQRSLQEERLETARTLLLKGDTDGAVRQLRAVVAAKKIKGVTDEALFRLALLTIPEDFDREEFTQAANLLERLRKEFPSSIWTAQAAPLASFLTEFPSRLQASTELRRQIKSLKDVNLSLTRENKELRLNIEKLKILDVELEKKTKP